MTPEIKYDRALAAFILQNGIAGASLRPMAQAAGTSDRMLIYHYGSKSGVVEAALTEIAQLNIATLESLLPPDPLPPKHLMATLAQIAETGQFNPVFAVFLELAAMALRGDDAAKAMGHRVVSHFHNWIAARITDPERAMALLGSVEGWAVLTSFGLDAPFPSG